MCPGALIGGEAVEEFDQVAAPSGIVSCLPRRVTVEWGMCSSSHLASYSRMNSSSISATSGAMDAGERGRAALEDGWRPEDVALLTTGTRHPEQKERQSRRQRRLLGQFLGCGAGVLRPRPRLQGPRATRGRVLHQCGVGV